MPVNIKTAETPNPNARRYIVDRPVQEGSKGRFFRAGDETDEPIVRSLLSVEGAESVMLLQNSITLNKDNSVEWSKVDEAARRVIEDYFS